MTSNGIGQPVLYTVAVTAAGVAISYGATRMALSLAGYEALPIATWLSIGLPAVLAPLTMFPLVLMLRRQKTLRAELEQLLHTDMLTALPNRRAFFAFADTVMERDLNLDVPTTAMMVDIDHFKSINDTLGHDAGDRVLKRVATAIHDAVASSTASEWTVARIGGEEFAVLVDGLVPTAVARLADEICIDVRRVNRMNDGHQPTTVSIGVAFRTRGAGIDWLLKCADDAAYMAKNNGRDRWVFSGEERQSGRRIPAPMPEPANDRRAFG
jgi:diguanylate cyclase (GGDEF)-like protein